MVEIKRSDLDSQDALAAPGSAEASPDDSRYRLIYSKSKVYVNPTAYARDNIPGFVALVKKASGQWLPRTVALWLTTATGSSAANISPRLDPRVSLEREGPHGMGQVCQG